MSERPYSGRSFVRSGGRGRGYHRGGAYGGGDTSNGRVDDAWPTDSRPTILAKPTVISARSVDEATVSPGSTEDGHNSERRPPPAARDEHTPSSPTPHRVFSRIAEAVPRERHSSSTATPPVTSAIAESPSTNEKREKLTAGIRLISESMEWCEGILEHLTENTDYIVIGAVGPQGCGKSTVLSMLGGNNEMDMYRQYVFRPASREAMETCRHQTTGVHIYVTKTRVILIDCQAVFSPGVLDDMLRTEKRYNFEFKTPENYSEIESMHLLAFMLQVCHTVLVCVDWFVDLNLIRQLRTADMLRAALPANTSDPVQYLATRPVNIVFVHQRAKHEEFKPTIVRQRSELLTALFQGSPLTVTGKVSLGATGRAPFVDGACELVNYLPLADMKLRSKTTAPEDAPAKSSSSTTVSDQRRYKGVLFEYEQVIADLRLHVRLLPRHAFANSPLSERQWFAYAAKIWDNTKKSHIIAEYGRTLP